MATLEERREKQAEKLKQLDAQIARKKAREKQKERKARDHALIQLGGLVLRHANLDWNEVDPQKAEAFFSRNASVFHSALNCEKMTQHEASSAWAALREQQREARKERRESAESQEEAE